MTAETLLAELLECGIDPGLTPDGTGITVPANRLTDAQRAAILGHKPELIACIQESARVTSELLIAAMRACDHWKDGPEAREQMRQDCLNTPPHRRAELRDHFIKTYRKEST